jgi:hypothetical protein
MANEAQIRKSIEKKHYPYISRAVASMAKDTADVLEAYGYQEARRRLALVMVNKEISGAVSVFWMDMGITSAKRTFAKLKKEERETVKSANFGFNESWVNSLLSFFNKHALEKVVIPISKTTRDIISLELEKAYNEGLSVAEAVKRIRSSDITKYQAERIVRTESTAAFNYGAHVAAGEFGYEMQKEWIEVKDIRTRFTHSHYGVGGQVRDYNERFSNGLLFPGDKAGAAGEVINCRCTVGYTGKRDANGRLIKKPAGSPVVVEQLPKPQTRWSRLLNNIIGKL